MYITQEMLENNNACREGQAWFKRHYPNGAELIDVINNRTVSEVFLEWGIKNLHPSEVEWQAYYNKKQINCGEYNKTIQKSKQVFNSQDVLNSENVNDSYFIFESQDILNSKNILLCEIIENSSEIFNSQYVYDSLQVFDSQNITNSKNIVESIYIVDSSNILNAENIKKSHYIMGYSKKTKGIQGSYFVADCENLSNCIFCHGIKDKGYYLFNESIDEDTYNLIVRQLKKFLNEEARFVKSWDAEVIPPTMPVIIERTRYYRFLGKAFYKWVKTLPNYNAAILFMILQRKEVFQ